MIVYILNVLSVVSTAYVSAYLMLFSTGKDVHPRKASLIVVTLSGIFIFVRFVHQPKAKSSMVVTEFGIVTEVRPVQPLKALDAIVVTILGISTLVIYGIDVNSP